MHPTFFLPTELQAAVTWATDDQKAGLEGDEHQTDPVA